MGSGDSVVYGVDCNGDGDGDGGDGDVNGGDVNVGGCTGGDDHKGDLWVVDMVGMVMMAMC